MKKNSIKGDDSVYAGQSKKTLILTILDILKEYSDEEHKLSQEEIRKKLESEYDISVDRKTVSRNLMNLLDSGYDVECTEILRANKDGKDNTIFTDWHFKREFSDPELRLLIDSLLFSKHIPYNQCKKLIEKLEKLSNRYFSAKVSHICNLPENKPENKQLFYTIEMLDEAIAKGKKVSFHFTYYNSGKKRNTVKGKNGEPRVYKVSPYQMAATNGRYYLICNNDDYDNAANYRVDYIENIKILGDPAKPMKKVKGLENGLRLSSYMAEHVYMFSGESVSVSFRMEKTFISTVLDWFGMDVKFTDETESEVTARVLVNEKAMFYWAMQYSESVEVLTPASLRENLREAAKVMWDKYEDDKGKK